jgi:hypothetical protein
MNTRIVWAAALAGAFVLGWAGRGAAADKDKPADDADKAMSDFLTKLKVPGEPVDRVKDEAVGRAFPKYTIFTKIYSPWPIPGPVPDGLKRNNVFAVGPDGKVQLLTDVKGLEAFFKDAAAPAKEEAAAKDAVRAWLRLTQEFQQDGFYKFVLQDDSTKVDGKTAAGKVIVMEGGNGEITAALTFDGDGKLTKVEEGGKLKPGPRPKCQATKLLDPDPVVRWMAEQDLLIMGRPAKRYLDEQRAKAAPELQKAIDNIWERICRDDH